MARSDDYCIKKWLSWSSERDGAGKSMRKNVARGQRAVSLVDFPWVAVLQQPR